MKFLKEDLEDNKIIVPKQITELYVVEKVHPSRSHVVCPKVVEGNEIISVYDNFVSRLYAVLFDSYENADKFADALNTRVPLGIDQIGPRTFKELEQQYDLVPVTYKGIHCYIAKRKE